MEQYTGKHKKKDTLSFFFHRNSRVGNKLVNNMQRKYYYILPNLATECWILQKQDSLKTRQGAAFVQVTERKIPFQVVDILSKWCNFSSKTQNTSQTQNKYSGFGRIQSEFRKIQVFSQNQKYIPISTSLLTNQYWFGRIHCIVSYATPLPLLRSFFSI